MWSVLKSCALAQWTYLIEFHWNSSAWVPTEIHVICTNSPEPLLLTDMVSTEILCIGKLVAIYSVEFHWNSSAHWNSSHLQTCLSLCCLKERSGSVVECLTRDRGTAGWASLASLGCGPWARHIYPSLELVQLRKSCPCLTERLLMGCKKSNQTNFVW